jgi:hypothetical protein
MPLRIKEHKILPAAVSLAVPKLKRSRRSRRAPDFTAHLSEPLLKLLEPPQKTVEAQEDTQPMAEKPKASTPLSTSPSIQSINAPEQPLDRGQYIPPQNLA